MAKVVLYVRPGDPYSFRLKEFLNRKRIRYLEKPVTDDDPDMYMEMCEVTGESEPPQLVIDGKLIGDYERVSSLDLRGHFDELLD